MQKKSITNIVVILAILAVGIYLYRDHIPMPTTSAVPSSAYTQAPGTRVTSTAGIDGTPEGQAAWTVLVAYTKAAQSHDLSTLKNLTYKVSDACADPKQIDTCNTRMDKASEITKTFKKSDFKNVWFDQRQIILSTDWHVEESDIAIGEAREIIYFVRDSKGNPKILFFTQPEEIVYSFIDPSQTKTALITRLKERITDSDTDALSNETETCTYESADPKTCVKTDPNRIDSNGNGWWDSIEPYLK